MEVIQKYGLSLFIGFIIQDIVKEFENIDIVTRKANVNQKDKV